MTEIEKAYKTLGLEADAPKEAVESRYDQLLKRERARIKRGESTNDNPEFAKITQAYRTILDYDLKKYTEEFEAQEYSKYKGMANKVKKIDHFWQYYKWHTIGAIALVALIIYITVGVVESQKQKAYEASLPPISLHVSFLGEYLEEQTTDKMDMTKERLQRDFPHLERIESDIIFVPSDPSMQVAYLQKAFILVGTESPDIYLLDEAMLEWGGNGEIFAPLDQYPQFSHLVGTPYMKTHVHPETNIKTDVAIDLTGTSLAKDLNVAHLKLYAAIRANDPTTDRYQNAIDFIAKYASELTP